jgi:RNA polymerase sigma-70 factor (ECF subfamily)
MQPTSHAEPAGKDRIAAQAVASGLDAADAEARREIEALIPRLRRYARALKRDPVAADDLVQDCLCRALAKLQLWERGTDLRAWLFTILHHQHCNDLRRSMRQVVSDPEADLSELPAPGADILDRLQLRDVERAIAVLPETQRQLVLLIGLEGMGYGEVADALGLPIGTVRSRLARARHALRQVMKSDEADAADLVQLPDWRHEVAA